MKVLFLDVDGVLNCRKTKERCRFPNGQTGALGVDPDKCNLIRRILIYTQCNIVLSSTWRKYKDMLPYLWANLGSSAWSKCIGKTPILHGEVKNGIHISSCRGDEIAAWLSVNPDVESFAILDDDSDMGHLKEHLIQTNFDVGLTEEIADQVIAKLNGKPAMAPNNQ